MVKIIPLMAQGSREMMGAIFETRLTPLVNPLVKAMMVQGKRYSHAVQSPGHGLGAPPPYVFAVLCQAIADLKLDSLDEARCKEYTGLTLD